MCVRIMQMLHSFLLILCATLYMYHVSRGIYAIMMQSTKSFLVRLLALLLCFSLLSICTCKSIPLTFSDPSLPTFHCEMDLVGTPDFSRTTLEYCTRHNLEPCLEFQWVVEKQMYEVDVEEKKQLSWLLSGDSSFLILASAHIAGSHDHTIDPLRR
jgi:hypothetical protein